MYKDKVVVLQTPLFENGPRVLGNKRRKMKKRHDLFYDFIYTLIKTLRVTRCIKVICFKYKAKQITLKQVI